VYPDWFHPNAEAFWINEIERFFDPTNGIDIDGIWIDSAHSLFVHHFRERLTSFFDLIVVNEPANFALPCAYPCNNTNLLPGAQAIASGNPPARKNPPPPKDAPLPIGKLHGRRGVEDNTQYQIHNAAGELAKGTIRTDLVHHNGLTE
jgi:alpha-glucosidase